ncbi:ATP-binding cassette domain-containing protein [Roseateles sp. BYS87W]|uniref:ATP-binding cassette domain-containing protein n=1 Tax=Pelomonas baiyunensis TaxID=3299026 RepID=A0ABW7GWT8_9BURK
MLHIDNVYKTYGSRTAVDGVTLQLTPGVVGLVGHNGAGKSTLLHLLATLTRPTRGQLLLDGQDIVARPDVMRQRLGYLPQDFGVYPHLTALEFLSYFAALKGVRNAARLHELLALVNLQDQAHQPAIAFSGGMRQRLGIAQALLNDPDVLIVDEPTAGLDPEERLRFRRLLGDLGQRRLVLLSTHIASDIENLASRIAVMRQGRLLAFESPQSFIEAAQGRVWRVQLSSAAAGRLPATVQMLQAQPVGDGLLLRLAHDTRPCMDAEPVQPTLEEALALLQAQAGADRVAEAA